MNFILLGTVGCHLCEEAKMLIDSCVRSQQGITIGLIDIAENTKWQQDYAVRIPVLLHQESGQTLDWPFTQADIIHFVNGTTP